MPEESSLTVVNTVSSEDKIRVVSSEGMSYSIEVSNLKNSLSVDDLSSKVLELETKADTNEVDHIDMLSKLDALESAVGEETVSGGVVTNSGLFERISAIRSDLAALDFEVTQLINNEDNVTSEDVISALGYAPLPTNGGVLEGYTKKLTTLTGTSTTVDLLLGNIFTQTLSGDTTYTITNAVNGQAHSFTLIITQTDIVRTITFPASVKWQGGEIPDMNTVNKTYILTFMTVDGGATWLGMFEGEF